MKDSRFYINEKLSLWKCFKYFWTPKNWFNYSDSINIETFWFTFLANLIFSLSLSALFIPFLILIIILFNLSAKVLLFSTLAAIVVFSLFLFIGFSLGGFAMTFNRANNAGISKSTVWLFYFLTSVLSTILVVFTFSGVLLFSRLMFVKDTSLLLFLDIFPVEFLNMTENLGNFFSLVSFCTWIWVGIKSEKTDGVRSDDVLQKQETTQILN